MGGDLGIWLACQVSLVSAPVVYAFINTEPSSRHTQGMALNQASLDSLRRTAWCGKASFGLAWILSGSAQTDALTRFAVFDTLNIVLDAMLLMDILVRSLTAPCPNEHRGRALLGCCLLRLLWVLRRISTRNSKLGHKLASQRIVHAGVFQHMSRQ